MKSHFRLADTLVILLACVASTAAAQQEDTCADALVVSTYNKVDMSNTDYRLAWQVSEKAYDQVKKDAGVNAIIYGVPVAANYSDFQKSIREKSSNYSSSFSQFQASNVQWTGLDPNSASAYSECIKSKRFSREGLHLAVKSATKDEVTVWIKWSPRGSVPWAKPEWTWNSDGSSLLPKTLVSGEKSVVLPRPKKQMTLAVNYKGYTDSIVVEPFPPIPEKKPVEFMDELKEHRGPEITGWSTNFSAPYTLCTPEMPSGWTINSVSLRLESSTERGTCGGWTTCGGAETDTPTRACRTVTVQGHTKGKYEGYGRATPILTVNWHHPK